MGDLRGARIAVVGGGAFGLFTAISASDAGARVTLFRPEPHASASIVAAGMLGPASEALLDPDPSAAHARFRAAMALWRRHPAFSALLRSQGAILLDPPQAAVSALARMGAAHRLISGAEAHRRQPAARACTHAVWLPDEAGLDPAQAVSALRVALTSAGGAIEPTTAPGPDDNFGDWLKGWDAVVVAAGYASRAWAPVAPPLARLSPIKGHILRFDGPPLAGPVVRTAEGYIAPQQSGALFGATMQFGRADAQVEPAAAAALHAEALRQAPGLAGAAWTARAGVRAEAPDGLPLAGHLGGKLWAATGARRNGWLLAPLVARAVVAQLSGEPPPHAAAGFNPARFAPAPSAAEP